MAAYNDGEDYSDESSYSDSSGSSYSSTSDSDLQYFPWLDKVGPRGELFYIEASSNNLKIDKNLPPKSDNATNKSTVKNKVSKLNPAKKLKSWMKKRKRKVRKSFKDVDPATSETEKVIETPVFIYRDVFLDVIPPRQNIGRRMSLCEELLGLEIGGFDGSQLYLENQIKVIGFASNFETPGIRYGDLLKSLNDIDVNFRNIDDVLKRLDVSSKVKVTVTSPFDRSSVVGCQNSLAETLIEELLGNPQYLDQANLLLSHFTHGVFYLSMEDESSESNEGVIYRFPGEDTPLFQLKGMLITLSHMISEVCSPPLLSCSVLISDEIIHAGSYRESNDTLFLAMPSSCCTVSEIQHFVTSIAKLLKFQFSTLREAFVEGKPELDAFFTLFLKYMLSENAEHKPSAGSHLLDFLPSVHWLPLPNDVKTEVEDILSELESSDFGSLSEGFDGNRRVYSILGSCLYYKGYLLCNHLHKSDLLDIHLYLHFNKILHLTRHQGVSELLIWQEVFPSRRKEQQIEDPDFVEAEGRYFMLVVAMEHCVLAVILEAGSCSLKAEGHPPPELFYVEEVQNTLIILNDCGIINAVEKLLTRCLPPVQESLHPKQSNSSLLSNLSYGSSPLSIGFRHSRSDLERGDGDSDVDSSYSDLSVDNLSVPDRVSKAYSTSASSQGSAECVKIPVKESSFLDTNHSFSKYEQSLQASSVNPVIGPSNTLFHYLHMDPVEGVFLAPLELPRDPDMSDICRKFYECCLKMRTVFARSLRNEELLQSSAVTKYGVNGFLRNVYEQGTLFNYHSKTTVAFHVVGRLFFSPEPRELYVCFQDSAQQDVVEIAFRLGFGLAL